MSADPLLAGIRVLDFGRYIAGPYCAALLAGLGAEVIRIERIDGGEDRHLLPLAGEADAGALFLQINRGKRAMTLDLRTAEAREVVGRLVATADVVVANLPGPSLKALGLDYASLAALGTLAALVERSHTGTGRHVEGSLLASALTVANSTLIEEAVTEVGRVATNNRAQVAAPADIFATRDGWIIVQVVGPVSSGAGPGSSAMPN